MHLSLKRILLSFFVFLAVGTQSSAQQDGRPNFSPSQQAASGWVVASVIVGECDGKLMWNTPSGEQVTSNAAIKLLTNEGHKRGEVLNTIRGRGLSYAFQMDRWIKAEGFKPNADNIDTVLCQFGNKVAGKQHPVGRFLKN